MREEEAQRQREAQFVAAGLPETTFVKEDTPERPGVCPVFPLP